MNGVTDAYPLTPIITSGGSVLDALREPKFLCVAHDLYRGQVCEAFQNGTCCYPVHVDTRQINLPAEIVAAFEESSAS